MITVYLIVSIFTNTIQVHVKDDKLELYKTRAECVQALDKNVTNPDVYGCLELNFATRDSMPRDTNKLLELPVIQTNKK